MAITLDGSNGISTPMYNGSITANPVTPSVNMKNRIINGAMAVWQRGTSGFTTSGNYSADRWLVSTGTSLSAVGQSSDVPSGYPYSLSVSGTNVPSARQYIESKNCVDLVGQSVTITVQIKQSSGAGSNAMYIYLAYANTTDTFSGLTQIGSTANITTTSSWATYTATFTNLPAGAANGLALIVGSNSAGASTFLITGVQLEVGSTASSFDYRPYGTELALCQRYCFNVSVPSGTPIVLFGVLSSSTGWAMIPFPVTPRVPATGLVSVTSNWLMNSFGSGSTPAQAIQFVNSTLQNITVQTNGGASMVGGNVGQLYPNAGSGQFYTTGSEL